MQLKILWTYDLSKGVLSLGKQIIRLLISVYSIFNDPSAVQHLGHEEGQATTTFYKLFDTASTSTHTPHRALPMQIILAPHC